MLIGGNRSTGIRTRVTVPTIATIRQRTIMKKGYRIANPDIRFRPPIPAPSHSPPWAAPFLLRGTHRGSPRSPGRCPPAQLQFPPDRPPPLPTSLAASPPPPVYR